MAKGFKTGGRQKGVPNKLTAEARQFFTGEIISLWKELRSPDPDWSETSNQHSWDRRMKLLEAAMKYAQLPKEINVDANAGLKTFEIQVLDGEGNVTDTHHSTMGG